MMTSAFWMIFHGGGEALTRGTPCGRQFASDRYEWLDLRTTGTYETEDGVHLTRSSARRAAALLRRFAENGTLE